MISSVAFLTYEVFMQSFRVLPAKTKLSKMSILLIFCDKKDKQQNPTKKYDKQLVSYKVCAEQTPQMSNSSAFCISILGKQR